LVESESLALEPSLGRRHCSREEGMLGKPSVWHTSSAGTQPDLADGFGWSYAELVVIDRHALRPRGDDAGATLLLANAIEGAIIGLSVKCASKSFLLYMIPSLSRASKHIIQM
jgi:hypothetical protein